MEKKNYPFAFALLTALFFLWGFITVMNDVLISTFRELFNLSNFESGLVQFSFFGAFFVVSILYFIISRSSGDPINRLGYKNGMATGLAVCGIGCILFYPAAESASYMLFLGALFVLASGVTVLQIAANPYAAILGTNETASSRLNLAQGFNSLGTTVGPIVGALLIFMVFSTGVVSPEAVGKTYLLYGCIFLGMAIIVKLLRLPSFKNDEKVERSWGALKFRHLKLGMLAIFCYVGAEVSTGSWLVGFSMEADVLGLERAQANKYLSWYWGGLMIGRLLGAISLSSVKSQSKKALYMGAVSLGTFGLIYLATSVEESNGNFTLVFQSAETVLYFLLLMMVNFIAFFIGKSASGRTLTVFAIINFALIAYAVIFGGSAAFWALIGTGLFNSIMWSNIFTLAIANMGKYTSQGSSLLIMSVVGGAIIPPFQGLMADYIGLQYSFVISLLPYAYLAWYGWRGKGNLPATTEGNVKMSVH